MEKVAEQLKQSLDCTPALQKHLFEKGFLITDAELPNLKAFPFYGNWNATKVGNFNFIVYSGVTFFQVAVGEKINFLIGHAYNPYTLEIDEKEILKDLSQEKINQLTGVFVIGTVSNDGIDFQLDASGMQYACYGKVGGNFFLSSHMRLLADILNLETDEFVRRLTSYRWYKYMLGNYLPGDLACSKELKRVIPNTSVVYDGNDLAIRRFYPQHEIAMCQNEEEYNEVIREGARIMSNTMKCISLKWQRPAISLTGGVDSNTTFASANGLYDKFKTFSYVSMFRESVDADAAKKISEAFNVKHEVYQIPDANEALPNFEIFKAIFEHNDGNIGGSKDGDTRKKIFLLDKDVCDVEVKSWISETIRAYAYKYFGRTHFPKSLSPRNYTSLYKIFLGNRRLCKETDGYFKQYLKNTNLKEHLFNYDETDFFIWEMEHGGKCGLNIGVMKSDFNITIPYNNRNFLDTLLRVPLDKRISDQHHMDMKKMLNQKLYDMNIRVVNLNETQKRKRAINFYYVVNSLLGYLKI